MEWWFSPWIQFPLHLLGFLMLCQCGILRFLFFHILAFAVVFGIYKLASLDLGGKQLTQLTFDLGAVAMLFLSNTTQHWKPGDHR